MLHKRGKGGCRKTFIKRWDFNRTGYRVQLSGCRKKQVPPPIGRGLGGGGCAVTNEGIADKAFPAASLAPPAMFYATVRFFAAW